MYLLRRKSPPLHFPFRRNKCTLKRIYFMYKRCSLMQTCENNFRLDIYCVFHFFFFSSFRRYCNKRDQIAPRIHATERTLIILQRTPCKTLRLTIDIARDEHTTAGFVISRSRAQRFPFGQNKLPLISPAFNGKVHLSPGDS